MNNTITLSNETIETLKGLIAEINYEESQSNYEDINSDLVIDNLYKMFNILEGIIL